MEKYKAFELITTVCRCRDRNMPIGSNGLPEGGANHSSQVNLSFNRIVISSHFSEDNYTVNALIPPSRGQHKILRVVYGVVSFISGNYLLLENILHHLRSIRSSPRIRNLR